jgi:hypothetical protein
MSMNVVWVASLLLATLAMLPAAAHLLELPNKIRLSGKEYLTAQRLYRGWALAGIVVAAALLSTLVLLFMLRDWPTAFALAWVAFLCIAGTQIVFWTFTYPVNRMTADWTFLPGDWPELRKRWEYSHAASAILNLIALVALIACLFWTNDVQSIDLDAANRGYAGAADQPTQYERGHALGRDGGRRSIDQRYI